MQRLSNELKKRTRPILRPADILFPQQLSFVQDPSFFKMAITSRRAGKTVSCAVDLLHAAASTPECEVLYITLSRKNAKGLVWRELKKLNRQYELNWKANESDLTLESPEGSMVYCSGAKDRTQIENFRGKALRKIYLDEAQSFPAFISELIDDVLEPTLIDYAGTLSLIGTPAPVPTGYFYNLTKNRDIPTHHWTFFDNPFIASKSGKTHMEILERTLKRRGVTIDHPSIQREWFGRWVMDLDSLVYRYDPSVCGYDEMPPGDYVYILGVDIGFEDADALAVIAWDRTSRNTFLVEESVCKKQGITELVEQIERLRAKYGVSKTVIDAGGLGKKIAEEIIRRHKIPIQAAEKSRKMEFIELMNDDLRTGRFKAKSTSQFADDALKVEYDHDRSRPDKRVISDRFHSDICDAVLYAWRESYSYSYVPEPERPKVGTPEYWAAEAEKLEEQALKYFKEQQAQEEAWETGGLDDNDF